MRKHCTAFCLVVASCGLLAGGELPIVFVSRQLGTAPDPGARSTAIEKARLGKLVVREADGRLRVLVDASDPAAPAAAPVDVADPDVSYDGSRIVFAGYSQAQSAWRIFEIGADGTGLRQVTQSDRQLDLTRYGAAARLFESYDDVDPCYLPNGRICFVSTRYAGVAPDGRVRATNLYVVNGDGSSVHRITTERFGGDTPAVDPTTGRIVYSRWWRTAQIQTDPGAEAPEPIPPGSPGYGDVEVDPSSLPVRRLRARDFPGVNSWFLAGIDPDGTNMSMFTGFRLDRELTQAYRPSFSSSGETFGLFIPQTPFIGYPRGNGVRTFARGPGLPDTLAGPQNFPRADNEPPPRSFEFVYASVAPLPDGRLLVTAASTAHRDDYGIYTQRGHEDTISVLYNDPATAELDATPLAPREVPPVVEETATGTLVEEAPRTVEEAFAQGGSFTFRCENIFFNAPVDVPVANAPVVGRRLAIDFFMQPQRTSTAAGDPPIRVGSLEIPQDGKIEMELPGGVPLFEVLRNPDGTIPIGRDGQIFHVGGMNFGRAGEENRCVGCHAGHSQLNVPEDATFTNLAPSAVVSASSTLRGRETPETAFRPVNLVDRSTARVTSEWGAERSGRATVDLRWSVNLKGNEVIIYGVRQGSGQRGPRTMVVHGLTVTTFLDGEPQASRRVDENIDVAGTSVPLDPALEFNALTVTIEAEDVTGTYEGSTAPALAEIEVIARALGEPRPTFLRADANCDGQIDLTDSITTLFALFLGGPKFCCEAAADANGDGRVNISDPISVLNFLFLGSRPPPEPFPACGPDTGGRLGCEQGVCLF